MLSSNGDIVVHRGQPSLEINEVSVFYGEAQALKGLSIWAAEKETVAILGSNGAGKTTLLKSLTGLIKPRLGRVILQGKDLTGKPPNEVIKAGIASVPEGRELFGTMTVYDNLILGTYSLDSERKKRITQDRLAMVFELFPVLKKKLKQKSETLSGGEQQMLALGRALMADPSLLALDEPSLGLAPILVSHIMNLLKKICLDQGITILLVEQNARAALKIADYVYVIERGVVVLEGPSSEVVKSPIIQSAYLGA